MMSEQEHNHEIRVPRGALIASGLLILFTITAVAAYRMAGLDPAAQISASDQPVETRVLRFEDGAEGTVTVYELIEGAPDRVVHIVQSGEGGFIRGVLRSFARARQASDIGREHPFLLKLQPNGSLLLEDPETGQQIDLQAFGPTNFESFRTMLNRNQPQ